MKKNTDNAVTTENTENTPVAAPEKGKRRGRAPMSQAEKAANAAAREVSKNQCEEGLAVLAANPQFQSAKFWNGVDAVTLMAVRAAMDKASERATLAEIAKLEAQTAKLKGTLASS